MAVTPAGQSLLLKRAALSRPPGPTVRGRAARRAFTMASSDDYVRFDQYENALLSLELVAHFSPLVREKPQHWKWIIVGAHDALQDAMVCAGNAIFDPLLLMPEQLKDIKRLHDHFRNNFAHFTPKGWSIEKAGLPRIVGAAIDAAEVLMQRDYVIVHMDEDRQRRLTDALATVRNHLPTSVSGL
jgi:hypothetical protein